MHKHIDWFTSIRKCIRKWTSQFLYANALMQKSVLLSLFLKCLIMALDTLFPFQKTVSEEDVTKNIVGTFFSILLRCFRSHDISRHRNRALSVMSSTSINYTIPQFFFSLRERALPRVLFRDIPNYLTSERVCVWWTTCCNIYSVINIHIILENLGYCASNIIINNY